MLSLIGSIIAT